MKTPRPLLTILLILFPYIMTGKNIHPRETITINAGWKFLQEDCPGAETPHFNDNSWEDIGLPHSFSIPYFLSQDFYVGYGWYRKTLALTGKDLKKRLYLDFDGYSKKRKFS